MTAGRVVWTGIVLALGSGMTVRAQVTGAPGWAVLLVPTPGVVRGGVVRRDGALLVGQGDVGPGLQSIVRIEAGRATTIAVGFGRLGGFDLADDGTLYVVDDCYPPDAGCEAATTGDTVYAIPEALTRTTPTHATDAELLPPGSIPFAADVLVTSLGLLVSDAAGEGDGRVVRVAAGAASDLVVGFDRTAGLAFDGTTLYVGDAPEAFSGESGSVEEVVDGSVEGAFVEDLSGVTGLAFDGDGNLLVGGGFTGDGPDRRGTLLAVDEAGGVEERASGFVASGDVAYDAERDTALVLDADASAVTVVCADEDADGVCDEDCSDGVALARAALVLKEGRTPGRGSLRFAARLRIEGGLAADPSSDGLRLQVVDAADSVVLEAALPGDERWSERPKERGWRYRDAAGVFGVTSANVGLDPRDEELVKVVLKSRRRASMALDGMALPLRVVLTLDASGECGVVTPACTAPNDRVVRCR